MSFVEQFFKDNQTKGLEDYLKKRYPTLEFKFQNINNNPELIIRNRAGIIILIFDLTDFNATINTYKCPIDKVRFFEFSQVSSEETIRRIYRNYLRGIYPDYRDKLIDFFTTKTNGNGI